MHRNNPLRTIKETRSGGPPEIVDEISQATVQKSTSFKTIRLKQDAKHTCSLMRWCPASTSCNGYGSICTVEMRSRRSRQRLRPTFKNGHSMATTVSMHIWEGSWEGKQPRSSSCSRSPVCSSRGGAPLPPCALWGVGVPVAGDASFPPFRFVQGVFFLVFVLCISFF